MRKLCIVVLICIFFSLYSCSSTDNQLKEVLVEALETSNGVRTGLDIKFSKFEVVDVLVKDSTAYYQEQYNTEKKNRTSAIETQIAYSQKSISELETKSNRDIVYDMLLSEQRGLLETATKSLQSLGSWTPDYLTKYDGRNKSEILAKLITTSFDFVTLKGNKSEIKDGKFLLSADGTEVLELLVGGNN